jgi:hypothetical protein
MSGKGRPADDDTLGLVFKSAVEQHPAADPRSAQGPLPHKVFPLSTGADTFLYTVSISTGTPQPHGGKRPRRHRPPTSADQHRMLTSANRARARAPLAHRCRMAMTCSGLDRSPGWQLTQAALVVAGSARSQDLALAGRDRRGHRHSRHCPGDVAAWLEAAPTAHGLGVWPVDRRVPRDVSRPGGMLPQR